MVRTDPRQQAEIREEIDLMTNALAFNAPVTRGEIINPATRYAPSNPRQCGDFVVFGYYNPDAEFDIDSGTLRDRLCQRLNSDRLGGKTVDVRPHTAAAPVFTYDPQLPVFISSLRNARLGADSQDGISPSRIKHVMAWVCMPPQDFLRISVEMAYNADTVSEFISQRVDQKARGSENITSIERGFRRDSPVLPSPVLELGYDARVRDFQEGRTRAFIARERGVEYMNVLVAMNKERSGSIGIPLTE